jgi:hypothetical protein
MSVELWKYYIPVKKEQIHGMLKQLQILCQNR